MVQSGAPRRWRRGRSVTRLGVVEVRIRDGGPGDEAELQVLFVRSSLANKGDRAQLLDHREFLEFRFPNGDHASLRVAVDPSGRAIGFATVVGGGEGFELEDLFVDPDAMRAGVGTALVRDLTDLVRKRGGSRIEVTANPHARPFYESVGFRVIGVETTKLGAADRMRLTIL